TRRLDVDRGEEAASARNWQGCSSIACHKSHSWARWPLIDRFGNVVGYSRPALLSSVIAVPARSPAAKRRSVFNRPASFLRNGASLAEKEQCAGTRHDAC